MYSDQRILPESLRWLLSQGKVKQAEQHARKIASFNRVQLPQQLDLIATSNSSKKDGQEFSFFDLFRTPNMRKRTFFMGYIW